MRKNKAHSLILDSVSEHCPLISVIIGVCLVFAALSVPVAEAVVSVRAEEKADSILKLYPEPFSPEGTYDTSIPDPDSFLGYPLGTKPIHYREAIDYLKALASFSPRAELDSYGETFEGRGLFYLVISSDENMNRLEEIKSSLGLLADPRKLGGEGEVASLIAETPAVAWLGYCVHGDELSGSDAAIQVAYQLVAGSDLLTDKLRRELVIIIDPLQNPDGRERYLAQLESNQGKLLNADPQSLQHGGFWPWGRGNHYLFDLNRDWFLLAQPETRGKVTAVLEWNPQLVVDAHEMGPHNSFLFSPPNEPFNPNLTETVKKWWQVFSKDQAKAFDRYGWSYFTRDWYEGWYPGYGSEWIAFLGAVAILYEQAGVAPSMVKQRDGSILTYRESVHHHFVSSIANLTTAAEHRRELMKDYHQQRKEATKNTGAFVFVPGKNQTRANRLITTLLQQGIEVHVAKADFEARDLKNFWGERFKKRRLPAGTYLVFLNQPSGLLVKAIMEFDPRMKTAFLEQERHHLAKFKDTKIYEVTAWSLPLAYDVETYFTEKRIRAQTKLVTEIQPMEGKVSGPDPTYAYGFSCSEDNSVNALVMFLQNGYEVRASEKAFKVEGIEFPKGSFVLRKKGNAETLGEFVHRVAEKTSIDIYGLSTALAEEGPDLGGSFFRLLYPPKIGIFAGQPLDFTSYGAIWYLLDREYRVPFSSLDINGLERMDLDKYNVLLLPQVWGNPVSYNKVLGKQGISKLKEWVQDGGTLIAIGTAAAFAADSSVKLSSVRLYRQSLDKLDEYREALTLERLAEKPVVDSAAVWGVPKESRSGKSKKAEPEAVGEMRGDLEKLKAEDQRSQLYMPRGAILRANLDSEHWLTSGLTREVPVILHTNFAYL
ncbi:MAG: M14 metallopeptidase family protein, partial [Candidatus Zixiibacteriota bacterium]